MHSDGPYGVNHSDYVNALRWCKYTRMVQMHSDGVNALGLCKYTLMVPMV